MMIDIAPKVLLAPSRSVQADQGLHCLLTESMDAVVYVDKQRMLRLDSNKPMLFSLLVSDYFGCLHCFPNWCRSHFGFFNSGSRVSLSASTRVRGMHWVLERIVDGLRQLVSFNDSQFGFVPSRGTTDAIFVVRQLQEKYLAANKRLQGWQNAGKYEYFPCRWYLPVNTGKYW